MLCFVHQHLPWTTAHSHRIIKPSNMEPVLLSLALCDHDASLKHSRQQLLVSGNAAWPSEAPLGEKGVCFGADRVGLSLPEVCVSRPRGALSAFVFAPLLLSLGSSANALL